MKTALILASFVISNSAAAACRQPLKAISDYYGAAGEQVFVRQVSGDVFAVTLKDSAKGAECKGGLAKVNGRCEVRVLRALSCQYL